MAFIFCAALAGFVAIAVAVALDDGAVVGWFWGRVLASEGACDLNDEVKESPDQPNEVEGDREQKDAQNETHGSIPGDPIE